MILKVISSKASSGAVSLVEALRERGFNALKISPNSTDINVSKDSVIINWGSSSYPSWLTSKNQDKLRLLINRPEYVAGAVDKLTAFLILREAGICVPNFFTGGEIDTKKHLVCRTTTTGSKGAGIHIVDPTKSTIPRAPLYVEYVKKTKEYRVHVFDGSVIDVQEKRKRRDFEGTVNYQIRTLDNGWVFCRDDVDPNGMVLSEAVDAVEALGLDFGAVDIIWNKHYNQAFVLEVNTAPGLEGTTIENYVNALVTYLNK